MENFGRYYRHIWLRKIDIYALTRVSGCANVWRNTISDAPMLLTQHETNWLLLETKKSALFLKVSPTARLNYSYNVALPMLYAGKSEADARKI